MLATAEICMYLTGKKRVFRDVCMARVVVEREKEQPPYTGEDEKDREKARCFEYIGVMASKGCEQRYVNGT